MTSFSDSISSTLNQEVDYLRWCESKYFGDTFHNYKELKLTQRITQSNMSKVASINKQQSRHIALLKADIKQLQNDIVVYQNSIASLNSQIEGLQDRISALCEIETQEDLEEEVAKLRSENSALESWTKHIHRQYTQRFKELINDNEELTSKLNDSENKRIILERQISKYNFPIDNINQYHQGVVLMKYVMEQWKLLQMHPSLFPQKNVFKVIFKYI